MIFSIQIASSQTAGFSRKNLKTYLTVPTDTFALSTHTKIKPNGTITNPSVDSIRALVVAKQDSIDAHTDTLQAIRTNLGAKADSSVIARKTANTLYVSTSFAGRASPFFTTVQAAVTAAVAGDKIFIATGTYTESVTVPTNYLTIAGAGARDYNITTDTWNTGGTRIVGTFNIGTTIGHRISDISFDGAGGNIDVFSTSTSTQYNGTTISNCSFGCIGTSVHLLLIQSGSGWQLENLKFFNVGSGSHGLAIRASWVTANNLFFNKVNGSDFIIVKSDAGSGDAFGVHLSNIVAYSPSLYSGSLLLIQSNNASYGTRDVSINNVSMHSASISQLGIEVQEVAGSCKDISISNVQIDECYNNAFYFASGDNIVVSNCIATQAGQNGTGYSFNNLAATNVRLVNCISRDAAGNRDVSGDFSTYTTSVPTPFSTGNTYINGTLTTSGIMGLYSSINVTNKLNNGWLSFAARDVSGSEAKYSLSNIGSINLSGNIEVGASKRIGNTYNTGTLELSATSSGTLTDGAFIDLYGGHEATHNGRVVLAIGSRDIAWSSLSQADFIIQAGHDNTSSTIFWLTRSGNLTLGSDTTTGLGKLNVGNIYSTATYATTVGGTNRALYADNTGLIGYVVSSQKYKENIKPLGAFSEKIYNLEPVSFDWKKDKTHDWGLIAEKTDKTFPEMVSYDKDGKPETVSYNKLIVLLLNEVQKLNKRIEVLEQKHGK